MKDIFNIQTIEEFKVRIAQLDENSKGKWGKMNVYQMLKHCADNEALMLREKQMKRVFLGIFFGKMALNSNIKNDEPLDKNSPTHPDLKIKGNGDVEAEKQRWMDLLDQYPTKTASDYNDFKHPFFGKMDSVQISQWAYKHVDHHLKQFGV